MTGQFGKRTRDMQGLPYRPEARQGSCQRGMDPSKDKEDKLPRTPPREHQGHDQKGHLLQPGSGVGNRVMVFLKQKDLD